MTLKTASLSLATTIGLLLISQHAKINPFSAQIASPAYALEETGNKTPLDGSGTTLRRLPIDVSDNQLSLAIKEKPLREVADGIAKQANIAILFDKTVPNTNVNVHFDKLPVSIGLQVLFKGYDTFFFFKNNEGANDNLASVWVYPKGMGEKFAPNDLGETSAKFEYVGNNQAFNQANGTATLAVKVKNTETEALLLRGLSNPKEAIRINALNKVASLGVTISLDKLRDMALSDPSATVRSLAVANLPSQLGKGHLAASDVIDIANMALSDPEPKVSDAAKKILISFDESESQTANNQQDGVNDPVQLISQL